MRVQEATRAPVVPSFRCHLRRDVCWLRMVRPVLPIQPKDQRPEGAKAKAAPAACGEEAWRTFTRQARQVPIWAVLCFGASSSISVLPLFARLIWLRFPVATASLWPALQVSMSACCALFSYVACLLVCLSCSVFSLLPALWPHCPSCCAGLSFCVPQVHVFLELFSVWLLSRLLRGLALLLRQECFVVLCPALPRPLHTSFCHSV